MRRIKMVEHPNWNFPIDSADQWDGFNEPGIEHFRGNPYGNLAREVIQNSLDARDKSDQPIKVNFNIKKVPKRDIPEITNLKSTFRLCEKVAKNEGQKAENFFERAHTLLESKAKLSVLEISEENTKGIEGPCKNGTPYYAYVKARGQSKKASDTASGSYGIGKFAPFTVSELRTIFISTIHELNGKYEMLSQGKSLLMSHSENGNTRQGTGYWGTSDLCLPINGANQSLPHWLARCDKKRDYKKVVGTSLYILGFKEEAKWENLLAASVLENFFSAIVDDNLVVSIGRLEISKSTITKLICKDEIRSSTIGMTDEPDRFDCAGLYFKALINHDDIIIEDHQNREFGHCQLRILIKDNLPKRVAFIRNGMFITDQLPKLKRFGDFKEFVAVVECLDSKGAQLLRAMEPPRHDSFEPNLLTKDSERRKAVKALDSLGQWIREMLKRHARDPVADVTEIDELANFFGDESDNNKTGKGEEVNPEGEIQIKAQPLKRKNVFLSKIELSSASGVGEQSGHGEGGEADIDKPSGVRQKNKKKTKGGVDGNENFSRIALQNIRAIAHPSGNSVIYFTPTTTGKVNLRFYEVGADSDSPLSIEECSKGKIKSGHIEDVDVKRGARLNLEVKFDTDSLGAIKVMAYEV